MNNPFQYEPSEAMLRAQNALIAQIENLCQANAEFRAEVAEGKMFGILLTADGRQVNAFSGQIGGRYDWDGFVPAVFDYLSPEGYFKQQEAEITALNQQVALVEKSMERLQAVEEFRLTKERAEEDIEDFQHLIWRKKAERDAKRRSGEADDAELIRESQFLKAELHRKKLAWREVLAEKEARMDEFECRIRALKLQRQRQSDALQTWLFQQFVFLNARGERRNLIDIFRAYADFRGIDGAIPSGAGECCEPKLLQFAFANGLVPAEIGMFWWGASPKKEVRRHLQFYPACNGKCRPILAFMLDNEGLGFEPKHGNQLPKNFILYEDDYLFVVNKPSGMLSVQGKGDRESVVSILQKMRPECTEIQPVHRLDMDTSGLLVVAKTAIAHRVLQSQFSFHRVKKEYVARLERPLTPKEGLPSGEISLPLRPDFDDRPRQLVDFEHGKNAVTRYQFIAPDRVKLFPETGRTHQLRVHCAHSEGLDNPIRGDNLYGRPAERLMLHAAHIAFFHPTKRTEMVFSIPPEF